jgi:hypothetical protein
MVGGVFGVVVLGLLMLDIATAKLNHLAPFLPPGAALKLANNPPSKSVLALAPEEFVYKVRFSFVYALQHTLRFAAILPFLGAGLTWILMGRRADPVDELPAAPQSPVLENYAHAPEPDAAVQV